MTKIILINGKKRSGKDFYASHIVQKLKERGKSAEIMSFADPLKEIICKTFDISLETFNEYKNEKTNLYTQRKKLTGYDYDSVIDFRTLIQRLGTEGIKPIFGESIWADLLYKKAENSESDYVIVPDFRFLSEDIPNYCTIHIINDDVDHNDSHASENELNDFSFDIIVDNTGYPDISKNINIILDIIK